VACGSGIMTVNSPSGSTLQCDTWLWHDMLLNSPGGSTLQCGRWLWDDMPCNSLKRPPYWNSTSGFDSDHNTAVTRHSAPVCEILSTLDHPQQKKMTSTSIFKVADFGLLGFSGSNNGFFEKPLYDIGRQ